MRKLFIIAVFACISFFCCAQKEASNVREGNKLYRNKQYTEAEIEYRKGLEANKNSFEASFNLGNALYKQGKMDEAMEQYMEASALQPKDNKKVAAAFHNLGNAFMSKKEYDKSLDAYKMALKNNPKDNETRYNYAYAKAMLKKQQEQKNNDKNKNDDKQKNKEQPKQDKQQQQQKQQEQAQSKSNPDKMSKENAQQILDAFMQDEKNVQDKVKKQEMNQIKKYRAEKDW